jgi:hypothetical protein
MASDENLEKILSRAGKLKTSFKYPGDEERRYGLLKDRAGLKASVKEGEVPYWVVVDLIDFTGREGEFMRFGYYRENASKWGSQTTLTTSLSSWKEIFVKAAREKEWFRDLLDNVMSELEIPETH